jgi:hypothetical protein
MTALEAVAVLLEIVHLVARRLLKDARPDVREATLELTLKWRRDLDGFIEAVTNGDADRVADHLADLERRRLQRPAAGAGDEDGSRAAGGR